MSAGWEWWVADELWRLATQPTNGTMPERHAKFERTVVLMLSVGQRPRKFHKAYRPRREQVGRDA